MMILLLLLAFASGAALATVIVMASIGGAFGSLVNPASAIINALAAAVMAVFSYRLYALTRAIESRTTVSEEKHLALMDQQRSVMSAQQKAMEEQALAMAEAANATRYATMLQTRSLVAGHPPALVIEEVCIERNDGAPLIQLSIRNKGKSAAKIRQILSIDSVTRRSTGEFGMEGSMHEHEDWIGTLIPRNRHIECTHPCVNITVDHMGPVPSPHDLLRPMLIPAPNDPPPPPPDVTMLLWIVVKYEDEAGDIGQVTANASLSPPNVAFTVTAHSN